MGLQEIIVENQGNNLSIRHWLKDERPRERLLKRGAEVLSDAELLAIFLGTGVRGKSAVDVGNDLLRQFEGLRGIVTTEPKVLNNFPGLGEAKTARLLASVEIGKRVSKQKLERDTVFTDASAAADYFMHELRDRPNEVFAVIYIDNRHRMIAYEELFYGTINASAVYPREVVRKALNKNAAALIFAHNHPSGVAEPSYGDTAITLRLKEALALVEIRLLDHIVIGDGDYVSLSDRGVL